MLALLRIVPGVALPNLIKPWPAVKPVTCSAFARCMSGLKAKTMTNATALRHYVQFFSEVSAIPLSCYESIFCLHNRSNDRHSYSVGWDRKWNYPTRFSCSGRSVCPGTYLRGVVRYEYGFNRATRSEHFLAGATAQNP